MMLCPALQRLTSVATGSAVPVNWTLMPAFCPTPLVGGPYSTAIDVIVPPDKRLEESKVKPTQSRLMRSLAELSRV